MLMPRLCWPSVLTTSCVCGGVQACVLSCGAGMTRLIDVLEDPREEIRNELLLVLLKLTQTNPEIQNAVAFQEGFERLLKIMRAEGIADGGIIICDCLRIIHNILKGNALTQKLFAQVSRLMVE